MSWSSSYSSSLSLELEFALVCVLQLALACSLVLASFLALVLVRFLVLVLVFCTFYLFWHTFVLAFVVSTSTSTRACICTRICARARPGTFRAPDHTRNPRARTRTTTPMFTRWTTGTIEHTRRDPQLRTHHLSRTHYLGECSGCGCSLRLSSVERRRSLLRPSYFGRFHSHFDGQWPGSQVWIWDS